MSRHLHEQVQVGDVLEVRAPLGSFTLNSDTHRPLVLIGAGTDAWNLFYLGISRLESPLYARIALQGIHDPDGLGSRVVLEIAGALTGVVLGWQWFSKKTDDAASTKSTEKTDA